MALAPVAAQLVTKFPFLAPVGLALATAITFQGSGPAVLGALTQADSTDPLTRLQGLKTILSLINVLLAFPTVAESAAQAQTEPAALAAQASAAVAAMKQATLSAANLPSFATAAQAQGFQDLVLDEYKLGNITEVEWLAVFDWTESEKKRIAVGVTAAAAQANPLLVANFATLPTFPSLDAADNWMIQATSLKNQGLLTLDGLSRVSTWYSMEIRRIKGIPLDAPLIEAAQKWGTLLPGGAALPAPAPAVPAPAIPAPAVPTPAVPTPAVPTPAAAPPIVNEIILPGFATLATNVLVLGGNLSQIAQVGAGTNAGLDAIKQQLNSIALAVSKQFPTQFDFPILQSLLGGIGGALTGAGVGSLAGAIALGLTNTAGPRAHNAQQARYECQSGFLGGLQGVITKLGPQLLVSGGLFFNSPLKTTAEELLGRAIAAQINVDQLAAPASEADALESASARLVQAMGFGLEAQMLSYSAEALTPLKQMGFNQLAGFLGDLAGFQRIAQGLMGTIETAGIYTPLQWAANRRFRPTLPRLGDIEMMFAKYALTREQTFDILRRLGYPEEIVDVMPGYLYRDPRLGELVRVFQYSEPGAVTLNADDLLTLKIARVDPEDPDAYYKLKLARAGYEPVDIDAFVKPLKMGLVRREQTAVYEQITRLYREGFITRDRASDLVQDAREVADVLAFRLKGLDLQREYEQKEDIRQMVLAALGRRLMTAAEASTALASIGMDPERVRVHVLRARMGLVPRSVGVVAVETPAPIEITGGAP